jgi:hypothetical protein
LFKGALRFIMELFKPDSTELRGSAYPRWSIAT